MLLISTSARAGLIERMLNRDFIGAVAVFEQRNRTSGVHVLPDIRIKLFLEPNFRFLVEGKLGVYAMKRVAAGARLPTTWLFEPTKCLDDRADYCLDCSLFP